MTNPFSKPYYLFSKLGITRKDSEETAMKKFEDCFDSPFCKFIDGRHYTLTGDSARLYRILELTIVNLHLENDPLFSEKFDILFDRDEKNRLRYYIGRPAEPDSIVLTPLYASVIGAMLLHEEFTVVRDGITRTFVKTIRETNDHLALGVITIDFRKFVPSSAHSMIGQPRFEVGISAFQYPLTDAIIPVVRMDPHDFIMEFDQLYADISSAISQCRTLPAQFR